MLAASGDEFHLVHIIKDETEKLREYYQEKSLGAPHAIFLLSPHACTQGKPLPGRLAAEPTTSRNIALTHSC